MKMNQYLRLAEGENNRRANIVRNRIAKSVAAVLLLSAGCLTPIRLSAATPPKPRAQVVSQLSLRGSPVIEISTEREHRRTYLYLRHAGDDGVTAIDITHLKAPRVVDRHPVPKKAASAPAETLGEYTAFETVQKAEHWPTAPFVVTPKTIRLIDVTDRDHPFPGRVFENVTAMLGDPENHRIFIVSADALYILRETPVEPVWVN